MSTKDIGQHAESLLNCQVCTEKFGESAKILPCQHTFCLPCLRRCYDAKQLGGYRLSRLACPICRKLCDIPAGGVSALPNDFRVKQFGELVDKIQRQSDNPDDDDNGNVAKCSICQFRGVTRRAEIFCSTCDKNFCRRCADNHRTNPVFKQHVTRPLDTGPRLDDDRCYDHNESLGYFCEQCERAVCSVCILVGHSQHHIVDMHDAVDVQREILDKRLESVKAQIDNITSYRRQLDVIRQRKAEARDACLAEIDRLVTEAYTLVDRCKKELTIEVNKAMDTDRENVEDVDKKLRYIGDQLSSVCDEVRNLSSRDQFTHVSFVQLMNRIRESVKNPKFSVNEVIKANCLRHYVGVVGAVSVQLGRVDRRELSVETHVDDNVVAEEHSHIDHSRPPDNEDVEDDDGSEAGALDEVTDIAEREVSETGPVDEVADVAEREISPDNDDTVVTQASGSMCGPVDGAAVGELIWSTTSVDSCCGVCFLSGGDVVAASCGNSTSSGSKLQAFDADGQFLRPLVGSVVARPWSLCYTPSNDSILVTDLDSTAIKILKSTLTIRDLSAWRGAGVIKPLAVSVIPSSGHYVLTDSAISSSSRVSLHAPVAGRVVKVRAFNSDDLSPAINYVAVDREDRIILSDANSAEIFIYSVEGKRLGQFKCQTEDSWDRMSPQGIAIDASNHILVAEQNTTRADGGRLTRFSPDGRLVDVVVEWKDEKPWAVAYDDSQRTLAISTDTALSVYRL